jgi:hypothetical protein
MIYGTGACVHRRSNHNKAECSPAADVALSVLKWDDQAHENDAFILANLSIRGQTTSKGKRGQFTSSIARLAQWDVDLVDELCMIDTADLIEPQSWLARWAATQGWDREDKYSWQAGTAHTMDGDACVHSGYLALHDPEALQRRVWSAHAGVFLPLIEERRTQLLPRVAAHLRFPLQTDSGLIQRMEDLEIGRLGWALRNAAVDRSTRLSIEHLCEARNRLAHLAPLPVRLALHKDLLG